MKKNLYSIKLQLSVCLLVMMTCLGTALRAQTTLSAGDIAFTGYNAANQNDFSFVLLTNISAGTTINFTDNGYKIAGINALNTGEGTLVWTSTTAMARFTQVYIQISSTGNSVVSLTAGSIAGGFSSFILTQAGDQILAYQGSSASPSFISGIHMNSDPTATQAGWDNLASGTTFTQNRSDVPPGLTSGVNCIAPDPNIGTSEKDYGVYNCTGASGATLAAIRTAINTPANWTIQDVNALAIPPSCSFSLSSPLSATISGTNVACNGAGRGVASVSASGGVIPYSYSWAPSGGTGATASGLTTGNYTCTITDNASTQITRTISITQPASALATSTAVTNVACNGGSNGVASITASGGTSGYTYLWSNGGTTSAITGLLAGAYSATVTDANNCKASKVATVTQPSALTTSTAVTNVACNGGSNGVASITASGGAGGYTYLWSNGGTTSAITGLLAGAYSATVTDINSCTSIKTAVVTQPTALSTSTAVTNVACNGGSNGVASITASGGAGGYTYLWSNGGTTSAITGLLAGAYSATVTDANSCTSTKSAVITQPTALTTSTAVTNVACNGGSNGVASITASGGAGGYTYLWSNGGTTSAITGLLAGAYSATVTDANSCTSTKSAVITQPTALITSTAVTTVACNGGSNGVASITASGGAGGYTYVWSNGGTTSAITSLLAGAYSATVTDANSCTSIKSVVITQPTALSTSTAVTTVACNGGSNGVASITPSGGAGGYTYLWSNGATTSAITGLMAGAYSATVTDANSCTSIKTAVVTQPTALVTSTAVTNVACNGGSNGVASITASGGAGGYTYLWSNGGTTSAITGLLAGAYSATVTDANSCTSIKTAVVTQPTALSTSTAVTNVACNGGSNGVASITASGGAGGYTYLWSNGGTTSAITGLLAGAYSATVTDANSCTSTKSAVITQPTALTTSTAVTNVACNGGSNGVASITASGGAGGYTYLWSNGGTTSAITSLLAGAYSATVTDANSCTSIKSVVITQPTALSTSTAVTSVACNGGSNGIASVSVSGGTGSYTYSWSPGGSTNSSATGLAAGNYSVTITDANSCIKTAFVNVTQPSTITATTTQTTISCFGGNNGRASVNVTGGTSPYSYVWTPSGGTGATASGLTQGTYTCTITDNNSCSTTKTVTITQPATAVTATTSVNLVSCFGGSNGSAAVVATGGTSPYTYLWTPSGGTASTATGLAQGNYSCTITDNNGCTLTKTVTVSQPASTISATTSVNNVSCFGGSNGSATVTATGGTSPYTYAWTPSGGTATTATGLAQGNYSCTITDNNGCTFIKAVSITQPAAIAATISSTNTACVGNSGVAQVSGVSGGTGAYTYSWSPAGGTNATTTALGVGMYSCTIKDANNCSLTLTTTVNTLNGPSLSVASQTNINCAGDANGAAQLSVTGGAAPYTYSWTPGISTTTLAVGLTAGSYTCVVTDNNGCTAIQSINITTPAPLVLSAVVSSSVLCNGGVATVSVSATGGSIPYTGTGTFTTTAGNQTYTVTDNHSCASTTSVSVTEPAILNSTASASAILCHGGITTITVSATGGTAPYAGVGTFTATAGNYSYTITDNHACPVSTTTISLTDPAAIMVSQSFSLCTGQSVTVGTSTYSTAGTYTNIITSMLGCDSTITTQILVNSLPSLTVSPSTATVCAGSPVSLTVSGANTYTWSNGASGSTITVSPTSNITYTVNGTSAEGCINANAEMASITVNALPGLLAGTNHTLICAGETATLSVTGALTYTWSTNSNNSDIAVSPTVPTTYTVSGTDGNGCSDTTTVTQDVSLCTTINEISSTLTNVTVYPNPSSGLFYVALSSDAYVVIMNAVGQEIMKQQITEGVHTLDLQNQADGLYFVKVVIGNQQKIIKINKQ